MASGFPGSIDNFTDPLANSPLNSPSHATLHSDVNDAVEKIETYMGLVKVVPTSVAGTGVTLSSTGTVNFTNAATVSVNGCFTSQFNSYKLVWRANSTGATAVELRGRFRASGTDTTTNYIAGQRVFNPNVATSTIDGNSSSTTYFILGNPGEPNYIPSNGEALIVNPASSTLRKGISGVGSGLSSGVIYTVNWFGGTLNNTAAHDGFSIFASANNITGSLMVYGWRE